MGPRVTVFVVVFAGLIVFTLQNIRPVMIQFLFWHQSVPLVGVISILALAGFILGYLTSLMGRRKRK
jgi:uncharacterized integral membrane protein